METVLIIDADSALSRALCQELSGAHYRVVAHVRTEGHPPFGPGITVVSAPRAHEAFAAAPDAPINHVVFGQPRYERDAADDFEALVASLEHGIAAFLDELQATGKLLARADGGQIWVLTPEASMNYYARFPSMPVDTRARHAAVKSFAKEMFRFRVRINCAEVQPLAEQATAEEWRRARNGLKTFAMRFQPNGAAAVARMLRHFLAQPDLPLAGMVIPVGVGFAENNI